MKINLGEYKEDNFSSREAMAEEIEKDTVRVLEARQKERKSISRKIMKAIPKGWTYSKEHMSGEDCICPDCNETKGHNQALSEVRKAIRKVLEK